MEKKLAALTIFALATVLSGCPRESYFTVTDLNDPAYPGLCLSAREKCSGAGISLSSFYVAEVDERGRYISDKGMINPMWIIEPVENVPLKELKYGQVPDGWKEKMSAKPLQMGRLYTAGGDHYFLIVEINGKVRTEIFTLVQFLEKLYKD